MHVVLPLAISFFTFQQIAYLADCYKADTQEYDFLSYCLFVTFFPQLIAGPIVHHNEMMPQFQRYRTKVINWRNLSAGIFIFSIGLFKKVVVADSFAIWANTGFDTDYELLFLQAWGASLSYTFQLYYDFSGYSDMAIGAALMLNIRLPVNFNSPYKATNIQDFWRRWHMTLSRWLRDYVYIPLGGNRKGSVRTYVNIVVTFLLGGLWHGAGWTFVVWGAMHGLAITVHRYWTSLGLRTNKFLGWLLTFLFVNCSWVFFRAESFEDAIRVLRGMAGINGIEHSASFLLTSNIFTRFDSALYAMFPPNGIIVFVLAAKSIIVFGLVTFLFPSTVQITRFMPYSGRFYFRRSIGQAALLGVTMFLSILTFTGGVTSSEFLYFNF